VHLSHPVEKRPREMPAAGVARVVLAKNLARSIRRGHPWVYRDALRPTAALADGATVAVTSPDGRALARGFWDARSAIAVRVLSTTGAAGGDLPRVVAERVDAALARRLAVIDRDRTDAFRWIHGEADGLPGVHADLYGDAVTLRFDGAGACAFYRHRCGLADLLIATARRHGIDVGPVLERKRGPRGTRARAAAGRQRQLSNGAGTPVDDDDDDDGGDSGDEGAARVLAGSLPGGEIEVRENGLRFGVDLARGQKGGLFLDQRENRAHVGRLARGRRVLNLFGYTGGFSLYAAAAGAVHTTTVDVAAEALAAARRNFQRNGLPLGAADFFAEDAFAFLERAAQRGTTWDLVISDPPSFAPSRKTVPAALRAYRRLHRLCAAIVAPGGILCAASCSSHVGRDDFAATVAAGAADAGRAFTLDEMRGAGADHPVVAAFPEGDYLKLAVGRL